MDTLGSYLQSIGRVPLLTPAEEIELGRKVADGLEIEVNIPPSERTPEQRREVRRSQKAKRRMIEGNLRLVVSVAKKYKMFGLDLMDLIQEGALGLNRAVEKFDPERGYKFSTYAYWWIRQAMTRALDTQSRSIRIPLHLTELHSKVRKLTRETEARTGRKPTYEELAGICGVSAERIREVASAFTPISSLNTIVGHDSDRSPLQDLIPSPENNDVDEDLIAETVLINPVYMKHLSDRERLVIELSFGLTCEKELNLAAIAKHPDLINQETGGEVSKERVRQIKANALNKMRFAAKNCEQSRRAQESELVQGATYQPELAPKGKRPKTRKPKPKPGVTTPEAPASAPEVTHTPPPAPLPIPMSPEGSDIKPFIHRKRGRAAQLRRASANPDQASFDFEKIPAIA